MKNIWLKVISLLLATFFWYFVTTDVSTVTLTVPIEIKNPPEGKVIISGYNPQAQVKLSGPSFQITSIASSPPTFRIRLPEIVPQRFVASLRPEELGLPSTVVARSVEPPQLELVFDDQVNKEVPVEVPRIGSLDENLQLEDVTVHPKKIILTGPRSELERVDRVETYPVDLREVKGATRTERPVRNPASSLTTLNHDAVSVSISVGPIQSVRRVTGLPVEMRAFDGGQFSLSPKTVNVELTGARSVISRLDPEDIIPFVRVPASTQPGEKVSVNCQAPPGVKVVAIDPPEVAVNSHTPVPLTPTPTATPVPTVDLKRPKGKR